MLRQPKGPSALKQVYLRNDRPGDAPLDQKIVEDFRPFIGKAEVAEFGYTVDNRDRSLGVRLAGEIARRHGDAGLAPDTFTIRLTGQAGQSLGAFMAPGVAIYLEGEAQDGVGKSLAGGMIAVRPASGANRAADVLVGNTCMYGATNGALYVAGQAGERLGVRNSGGTIVVEGCGDHGCEYMTGGQVMILGPTGYNFAAGMSGGVVYVWDVSGELPSRLNKEMVLHRRALSEDAPQLKDLLTAHLKATDSVLAKQILDGLKPEEFWVVTS
jgi:glutamate synthase domain-containing protein 3